MEVLSWLFRWHCFWGHTLTWGCISWQMGLRLHFLLLLEIAKYASVIEVLAHASGLEIEFVDGTLGKSATQMKHFSSGSLSATNVSQAVHKCHWSRILKYHFQKQYTGKYNLSLQFFFTFKPRWNSSIPIRPHHSKVAGFLSSAGF